MFSSFFSPLQQTYLRIIQRLRNTHISRARPCEQLDIVQGKEARGCSGAADRLTYGSWTFGLQVGLLRSTERRKRWQVTVGRMQRALR